LIDLKSLKPGYGLTSNNGQYKLEYGSDGTLNVIGIVTDKNGNLVKDKKTNTVKTENIWKSKIKGASQIEGEGQLIIENGLLNVYNSKGESRFGPKGIKDENGGSKLVMEDNGSLVLYDSEGQPTWSSEEGFTGKFTRDEYTNDITNQRINLQEKTRDLHRLATDETDEKMNRNVLINILLTIIASGLFYFLIAME
jgi:hypothetical protein